MSRRYYPWHLYWKYFFTFLIIFSVGYFFTFHWFVYLVSGMVLSAVISFYLVNPIAQLSLKALRMASKKQFQEDGVNEKILAVDNSDYFEIERALEKIENKLHRRKIQIAHEREESKALMGALQDAVVSIQVGGMVSYFNSSFASQFLNRDGLQKAACGELRLYDIIRDPEVNELFTSVMSRGRPEHLTKKLNTELSPHGRSFELTVTPLREEKGSSEIYGVLAVFHDISELKKVMQIRVEFVENASHELRTPLTSIKGYLETAKEELKTGQVQQAVSFLEIVTNNVNRLIDLVNDLLTISKLENKSQMRMELIQPMILSQEVIQQLSAQMTTKNIRIQLKSSVENFVADRSGVEQVLNNLLDNAIKYIQEGAVIDVDWVQNKKSVELFVKDNGPGIAPEHLERLFERFYRVDRGRQRDSGGTGLGLAIVKHIVQSHGGSVSVDSELGKGSTFHCVFPIIS